MTDFPDPEDLSSEQGHYDNIYRALNDMYDDLKKIYTEITVLKLKIDHEELTRELHRGISETNQLKKDLKEIKQDLKETKHELTISNTKIEDLDKKYSSSMNIINGLLKEKHELALRQLCTNIDVYCIKKVLNFDDDQMLI